MKINSDISDICYHSRGVLVSAALIGAGIGLGSGLYRYFAPVVSLGLTVPNWWGLGLIADASLFGMGIFAEQFICLFGSPRNAIVHVLVMLPYPVLTSCQAFLGARSVVRSTRTVGMAVLDIVIVIISVNLVSFILALFLVPHC